MQNPYSYTLGQIECIILSEQHDRDLLQATKLLAMFLVNREKQLQSYAVRQVAEQRQRCRTPDPGELPRRKLGSLDRAALDTCALVNE